MTDAKKIHPPEPLADLGAAFSGAGHELYLVGGYVRDTLFGRGGRPDVDATTEARPEQFKPILRKRAESLWDVGEKFGTIGAVIDGLTTFQLGRYAKSELVRRRALPPR